jgi:hypothetical protein
MPRHVALVQAPDGTHHSILKDGKNFIFPDIDGCILTLPLKSLTELTPRFNIHWSKGLWAVTIADELPIASREIERAAYLALKWHLTQEEE